MAKQLVAETCRRLCCLWYNKFTYMYMHWLFRVSEWIISVWSGII